MKRRGPRWDLWGQAFTPWQCHHGRLPLPESPHEFSMRLAAHLCRDRPHRHHRPWTKLVNLLTARTFSTGVATVLSPSPGYSMHAPYFVHLPHKLISERLHPHCVMVIENIGFLVTRRHLKPSMLTSPECRLASIHRLAFFYFTMYREFKK